MIELPLSFYSPQYSTHPHRPIRVIIPLKLIKGAVIIVFTIDSRFGPVPPSAVVTYSLNVLYFTLTEAFVAADKADAADS